jgi:hypothetical protein
MNTCKLGLHKWTYTNEKKSRSCGEMPQKRSAKRQRQMG